VVNFTRSNKPVTWSSRMNRWPTAYLLRPATRNQHKVAVAKKRYPPLTAARTRSLPVHAFISPWRAISAQLGIAPELLRALQNDGAA
jgi:hypothetical protein